MCTTMQWRPLFPYSVYSATPKLYILVPLRINLIVANLRLGRPKDINATGLLFATEQQIGQDLMVCTQLNSQRAAEITFYTEDELLWVM